MVQGRTKSDRVRQRCAKPAVGWFVSPIPTAGDSQTLVEPHVYANQVGDAERPIQILVDERRNKFGVEDDVTLGMMNPGLSWR